MELQIKQFLEQNKNYVDLLSSNPYNLKISYDGDYMLLKYNQLSSDFSNPIVKEARGIIFNKNTLEPVCIPFFKFMNAEESNSDLSKIDWTSASVQEKIDGSLIKVWYDKSWHVSTNSIIDAFTAPLSDIRYKSFGDLFINSLPMNYSTLTDLLLNKDYTYMFELVSPYNRVVIEYKNKDVYFLGARNNKTLQEVSPEDTRLDMLFKIPKRFNLSTYDDVKNASENLPWNEEGYVVCDKNFNRVKVKSPSYVKAHYARMNNCITYDKLLDIYREGEAEEFLTYAGDYKEIFTIISNAYESLLKTVSNLVKEINEASYNNRKEFAMKVLERESWQQPYLFMGDKAEEELKKYSSKKLIDVMRKAELLND